MRRAPEIRVIRSTVAQARQNPWSTAMQPGDDADQDSIRDSVSVVPVTVVTLAILALCVFILRPFLAPAAWASVVAFGTWPLYAWLRGRLGGREGVAALLMTGVVAVAVILPLMTVLVALQREIADALRDAGAFLRLHPQALKEAAARVPGVGDVLGRMLDAYPLTATALLEDPANALWPLGRPALQLMGGVSWNVAKFLLMLVMLYFAYRDSPHFAQQLQRIKVRYVGSRFDASLQSAAATTRGVFEGVLVTVVAQGAVAGLGYWLFGFHAPVLLAVLTGLLSVLPLVGTGLIWAPAAVWSLLTGETWAGVGLLAWGSLLVHPIDNILRPLILSRAARLPFSAAFLGIFGGISAFGAIGVFLGPVLLGVGLTLWRELVAGRGGPENDSHRREPGR
jgi:predicted PurR-regulated permease PerM